MIDEPGHLVVVLCGGGYVYIPFKNRENASNLCDAFAKHLRLVDEQETNSDISHKNRLVLDVDGMSSSALVVLEEVAGWYISFGSAHAKAVERLADAAVKSIDPDRDAEWRGNE